MDIKGLIRDAKKVREYLRELPDRSLVTTKGCKIIIPSRYADHGLAQIGIETYIVGIYAIIVEDRYYGVSIVNAMIRIEPTSMMKIIINEEEYYEFTFEPGSVVMPSTDLVKTDTLVYKIYDEIISKGNTPWYLGYLELGKLFDTAVYHAGAKIGQNQEVTELIISLIARNPANRHEYYRSSITTMEDLKTNPPAITALRSVIYAASNTLNKLAGSYFSEGLVSALVSPATRTEHIEKLLRA